MHRVVLGGHWPDRNIGAGAVMGLSIEDPVTVAPKGALVSDRALFVDADGVLVEAGDVRAAVQVASRAGKTIPAHAVLGLGLRADADGRIVQGVEPDAKEAVVSEPVKEEKKPAKDKQRGGGKTK